MDDKALDDILNSTMNELENENDTLVKLAKMEAMPLFEEFVKIFYEEYPQFSSLKLNLQIKYK